MKFGTMHLQFLGMVLGLGKPKQIFVFGSVWEVTEYSDRKPRRSPCSGAVGSTDFAASAANFFFREHNTQSWMIPNPENVFLIVPVNSTLVRKDGVPSISYCD